MDNPSKTTGNMFVNDYRKSNKHPEFTGSIEISRQQIQDLIEKGKRGEEVKIKLSLWTYPSKRDPNQKRLFIVADTSEYKKKEPVQNNSGWGGNNNFDDDPVPF